MQLNVIVHLGRAAAMLVSLLLLAGCGASTKKVKVAEKDYDWSDYKGTYAAGGDAAKPSEPAPKKVAASEKSEKSEKSDKDSEKKISKAKIQGESVSSVSADVVAGASKTALKSNVVSTNTVVGAEYEQLQVVLNKGVAVQIVRPAAKPDGAGPKVRSPKARSEGLAETDASYYDEQADVLVLVQAAKKATSKKALKAILKKTDDAPAAAEPAAAPAKPKKKKKKAE